MHLWKPYGWWVTTVQTREPSLVSWGTRRRQRIRSSRPCLDFMQLNECSWTHGWPEDGVVSHLNPLPTTTVEQFDKLDYDMKSLIKNQVVLTDEQVKTLMFSIGPHPQDLTGHIAWKWSFSKIVKTRTIHLWSTRHCASSQACSFFLTNLHILTKSLSKRNWKKLEPEPGQVLTLSLWYKTKSKMDVHVVHPWTKAFVQVHFTTDELRPSSGSDFF